MVHSFVFLGTTELEVVIVRKSETADDAAFSGEEDKRC